MVESFTPGPWSYDYGTVPPDGPGTYADIYVDGGETIIAHFNNLIPEGLANARLITAAPSLLEALLAEEDKYQRGVLNMTDAEVERVVTLRRAAIALALSQGEVGEGNGVAQSHPSADAKSARTNLNTSMEK